MRWPWRERKEYNPALLIIMDNNADGRENTVCLPAIGVVAPRSATRPVNEVERWFHSEAMRPGGTSMPFYPFVEKMASVSPQSLSTNLHLSTIARIGKRPALR